MAFTPPDFDAARDDLLALYRNQIPGADVRPGTEVYARASMVAGATALLARGLLWVRDQIFPDTSDTAHLERHAGLYGLARNAATTSAGTVLFSGTNGTTIPVGQALVHQDGTQFETTDTGVIAAGVLVLATAAVTAGSAGNRSAGDALTVQAPPVGCDGAATVDTDFIGGTDVESDAELLARLLLRIRFGSAGGTRTDYETWAGEVDGVIEAHALPLRRGPGTVTLAVFSEGVGGWRAPGDLTLRKAVADAVDLVRPVTADVDVPAVTELSQDVAVEILEYEAGYAKADVQAAVEAAIEAHVYGLRTGEVLYRSRLGRAISAVAGVLDYDLTVPATNVEPALDFGNIEILVPGTITVT